ncbi:hypothetical protein RH858_01915 [Halalkaliarchaeum sp. AArc-GB]|nr:hypothetical protein [Halalkaliarchaeum sp. AArc-GB]MDR5671912.1 hypothetical protein [Halalkaliarchaeum sp. AArc-GB]
MTAGAQVHKTKGKEWGADGVEKTPKALSASSVPEGERDWKGSEARVPT